MPILKPSSLETFHSAYAEGDATICNVTLNIGGESLQSPDHAIRRTDSGTLAAYLFQEIDAGNIILGNKPVLPAAETKPQKITLIKNQANKRILALYDIPKQSNMNAEATKLTNNLVLNGSYTPEEQARADELDLAWTEILAIRTRSNDLEAGLDVLTDEQIMNFDPGDDIHWA